MTDTERAALDLMTGHSLTRSPVDRARAAIAIRAYPDALPMVLAKRADWLVWLTLAQRDWQTKVSRRPSKAKHHDSIAIREKYVRAQSGA